LGNKSRGSKSDRRRISTVYFAAIAAAATAAAVCLVRERLAKGFDAAITASDVIQYMIEVEKKKPAVRIVLQDLRVLEVIFLLHLAEERGCSNFLLYQ
jgi:hypothetical protein